MAKMKSSNKDESEIKVDGKSPTKADKKISKNVRKKKTAKKSSDTAQSKFPRHSVLKAIRVPKSIIEQNAGKSCSDREAASYVGVGFNGPFRVEISSAIKYGFLERPSTGKIQPTALAKKSYAHNQTEMKLKATEKLF